MVMLLLLKGLCSGRSFLDRFQEGGHQGSRFGGVEQAKRYGVTPVHRQDFEQRMDIVPALHRHQNTAPVHAVVEDAGVVKVEVHDLNLGVIFPDVIPQEVHIMAPPAPDQHQLFAVEILYRQAVFLGQRVVGRYSTADGFPGKFQSGAAAEFQHGIVKDAGHHIDVLAKVG